MNENDYGYKDFFSFLKRMFFILVLRYHSVTYYHGSLSREREGTQSKLESLVF